MVNKEVLDVVDDTDRVIGRARRQVIHQSGLLHRGVHVFLFTPDSKLLVQMRSHDRQQFPGALDCSVSEHVRPGESYLDGALRGLHEELGLRPVALEYRTKFRMNYGFGDNHISAVYQGITGNQTPRINAEETQSIDYYTLPELETLLLQQTVQFSKWFRQLLLWYLHRPSEVQVLEENDMVQ